MHLVTLRGAQSFSNIARSLRATQMPVGLGECFTVRARELMSVAELFDAHALPTTCLANKRAF